ncbi:hypothetical protein Clacol_000547 [Clathrus columnatus]|uniref:Uncharacterized protein n=1 Tax=Clathrus columnatus TaxID=1419009 RepID=A0AAV5A007_9AGAM|nr:hypothetical protein Clacol_000547 [Clathrus columnatus]
MALNSNEQTLQVISRLPQAFDKAVESGQLIFFPSTVILHVELAIEFHLRLCPALQKKPTSGDHGHNISGKKKGDHDPFAPPYETQLYIGELEEDEEKYVVLLNKFSVVPRHFLLVSKEYRSQTSPLSPSDLLQSYWLLLAAKQIDQSLIAFYNCGDASGASQLHKHIQFIPIEGDLPIEKLAKLVDIGKPSEPFSITQLPYANGIIRLPSNLGVSTKEEIKLDLLDSFLKLLDFAIMTTRHNPTQQPGPPSYNVILTLEHMYLIPRSNETYTLTTGNVISVNSLGFGGMMLAKSEEELEAIKSEGVLEILKAVGMNQSEEIDEI